MTLSMTGFKKEVLKLYFLAHRIRFGLQTLPAPVMHGSRMDTAEAASVIERETAIRVPITSLLSSLPKQSSETDVLCEDDMIIRQQSVSFLLIFQQHQSEGKRFCVVILSFS